MGKKPGKSVGKNVSKSAGKKVAKKSGTQGAKKAAGRSAKTAAPKAASTAGKAKGVGRAGTKGKGLAGGKAKQPGGRGAVSPAADSGNAIATRAATLVGFGHRMLADMAAGIPDDKSTAQLPGAYNHKLWTLGHMADSNQWFAALIDGQPMTLPAEWSRLFGMGSKPEDNPGMYPPIADVRAAFEASVDRLTAAISARADAELGGPPAGDGAGFVHDKLDSALKAVWHYGWHLGQLASLRKGLGLPALTGQ